MNVHRGDVVLVDFPYSDRTGSKVQRDDCFKARTRTNMIRMCLFVVTSIFMVGCGSQTKPAAITSPDPLETFKRIVDTAVRRANESPGEVDRTRSENKNDKPRSWYKRRHKFNEPQFDVKRTDSLSSPFAASIAVAVTVFTSNEFPTEAEALAASEFNDYGVSKYEFEYAFQDGKWLLKSYRSLHDGDLAYLGWLEIKFDGTKDQKEHGELVGFFVPQ